MVDRRERSGPIAFEGASASHFEATRQTRSLATRLSAAQPSVKVLYCSGYTADMAAAFPGVGIGLLGVSLAFGLTVLTMAFAIGPISGCHLNPAVSFGLAVAKRFAWKDLVPYWIAQVLGAIAASAILYVIATGNGASIGGFAANGFGEHSPGKYGLGAAFVAEVVMTCFFLFVILGATAKKASVSFAPIAIGLCLTLIHLISIPVTNTSVNPARSTAPALFVGG
jgi:Glycerol uptake facilitator and related permeases (Major Intrinsic Protein Family)